MTKNISRLLLFSLIFSIFLLSCTVNKHTDTKAHLVLSKSAIDRDLINQLPDKNISYEQSIKPILGSRCVVCHGCYDAPCQLKLSSAAGLQRGATKKSIYGDVRLKQADPTRLFIDAESVTQWRNKGFFSVLNEKSINEQPIYKTKLNAEDNLRYSLLYQMLKLKNTHPQATSGKLETDINLDINAKEQCATLGEFKDFSEQHPGWGMPYGLPNLSKQEYRLLVQWIAQGSPIDSNNDEDKNHKREINRWETFFNQSNLKHQLVSRYIYEHLFLAKLYFKDIANQQSTSFFRLVRSTTPPGQKIKEIVTIRPYDSPGKKQFFYRLQSIPSQSVIKNHNIYPLSNNKMQRFKQLFFEPDYAVTQLPSYNPVIASNPLNVFQDIPAVSRYKFLLDNSHFFIQGFIKGPVCRGQISLNVIEDYFWVVFINPDAKVNSLEADFLKQNINYFQLPADKENTLNILSLWTRYWRKQKKYIRAKIDGYKNIPAMNLEQSMQYLYSAKDNSKDNSQANNQDKIANAALTIFRHFDSASVSYGLIGQGPETTWVVDYPIFERIHYLLVAGFDVYGNVGHQLNTRIYMDFLRMEGEDNFLAFIPVSARKQIRDKWYKGIREKVAKQFQAQMDWLSISAVNGYQTNQPKLELYKKLKQHLQLTQQSAYHNNHGLFEHNQKNQQLKIEQFMQKVSALRGDKMQLIPDITFIRLKMKNSAQHRAFTVINNKAYKHVTSLFEDETKTDTRDYNNDTITIVDWLEGSYPNFFLDVSIDQLDQFSRQFTAIKTEQDYEQFISQYGVRRTSDKFWELSDWFTQYYKKTKPIQAGYFDLNRYQNR